MREFGRVIVDQLNLREQPGSAERDIITTLKRDTMIEIMEHRQGTRAHWLRVEVVATGRIGWCAMENSSGEKFVRIDPPRRPPPPQPTPASLWPLWAIPGGVVLAALIAWIILG